MKVSIGDKFTRLTVITQAESRTSPSGKVRTYWLCECSCGKGKSVEVRNDGLTGGRTRSCGCLRDEAAEITRRNSPPPRGRLLPDLSGKTYGMLEVVLKAAPSETPKGRKLPRWECTCACGQSVILSHERLQKGDHISCGCVSKTGYEDGFKSSTDEFASKANAVHGNKYDYSQVEYRHSQEHVKILCREHGVFEQRPSNHLSGTGCYECWNDSRSNDLEIFITKAKQIHQNLYDYSKVTFIGNRNPVIIICKKHGEFEQKPSNHLSGRGCNDCGKEAKSVGQKEFVRRSREHHGNMYDYSCSVYEDTRKPVHIICPDHGVFFQKPAIHMSGSKCPKCSSEERALKQHWDYVERCKLDEKLANSEGILYLLELSTTEEIFLKVGVSSSFSRRLAHYKEEGLNYKVLKSITTTAIRSALFERDVLKSVKEEGFKYIPNAVFAGWTECSTLEGKDYLFKLFEEVEINEREYRRAAVTVSGGIPPER